MRLCSWSSLSRGSQNRAKGDRFVGADFQKQIEWVDGSSTPDEAERRGLIVSFQLAQSTLNCLIRSYKNIGAVTDDADEAVLYGLMIKKTIVGMLYEIRQAAEQRAIGALKNHGTYDDAMKAAHRELLKATDAIPEMKAIRNAIAFHMTDVLSDPKKLSSEYASLEGLDIDRLDAAIRATYRFVGQLRKSIPT